MGFVAKLSVVIVILAAASGLLFPELLTTQEMRPANEAIGKSQMKAAVYEGYGDPNEVLELKTVDVPKFGAKDVVIQVESAALNPVDWKFLTGSHSLVFGLLKGNPSSANPFGFGFDVAGRVIAVGEKVQTLKLGDEVYAMVNFRRCGTVAEYVAVEEDLVARKPKNVGFDEAAAVPLVGLTSLQAIEAANIKKGDKVLVLGGSSGTGSIAVQIAKEKGAHVVTTCSTRNIQFCQGLGADEVINYQEEDWSQELVPNSFDLVYDCVGGPEQYQKATKILKGGKHFVTIVGDGQKRLSLKHILEIGFQIGSRKMKALFDRSLPTYKLIVTKANAADLSRLAAMIEAGTIKPVIDSVYKLDDVKKAVQRQMSGKASGKVVVKIHP